jgi:hypothetical protein
VLVGLGGFFKISAALELGCGQYSTPTFLDRRAFPNLESLDSVENDPTWTRKVGELLKNDSRCQIGLVDHPMWAAVRKMSPKRYDLVFIDDSQTYEERAQTIKEVAARFSDARLVVIHDSEVAIYQSAAKSFRNIFNFTALNPNTSVVWNESVVDQGFLKEINKVIKENSSKVEVSDLNGWISLFDKVRIVSRNGNR